MMLDRKETMADSKRDEGLLVSPDSNDACASGYAVAIREYRGSDISAMREIWNEVVRGGMAIPQIDELADDAEAEAFFGSQTVCAVAEAQQGILGLYILHPNNVGRCGHIANSSYAVASRSRGMHIGERLVRDSLVQQGILGLYILHPNNVGRCGHIANSSYAVASRSRGMHIGERLVRDSLVRARDRGFRVLQFNAVVASNASALHLYEKIGFTKLGIIPGGFLNRDGVYEDIIPHYYDLTTL